MSKGTGMFSNPKFLLPWLVIFHLLAVIQADFSAFQLDVGNPNDLCPNKMCDNGEKSYLCQDLQEHKRCQNFKNPELTNAQRRFFLEGHNGIRNKVAKDFGITNMNLLYWNDELETTATYFLHQCLIQRDQCRIVGSNDVPVNQNMFFTRKMLGKRWPGAIVRNWYLQIGSKIKSFEDFLEKRTAAMNDFSQMIWPQVRFIGCGAARMFDGYLSVCYYHPPYERNKTEYLDGIIRGDEECGDCPDYRPTCSIVFKRLCGIDNDQFHDSATNLLSFNSPFFIIIILYNLLNFLI